MGDELTGIDLRTDQHREVARLLQRHLPDTEVWAYGSRVKGALNQHLFKVKGKEHPLWFFAGWVHQHMPEFCAIAKNKTTTMGYIKKEHLSQAQCIGPGQKVLKKLEVCIAQLLNRQIFVQ